ncbi:hypothetical protein CDIK_3669 [Cucumispora dikerogammari]|nr:hypothetical protein CDIK_3669 [Cucumispora dikerogammari]
MSTVKKNKPTLPKVRLKHLKEFTLAADVFTCILCFKNVNWKGKWSVDKHILTENYQKAKEKCNIERKSLQSSFFKKRTNFWNFFINTIVSADFSLCKMKNEQIK